MSEAKHTPGPWVLDESMHGDNFRAVSAPNHGELATVVWSMEEEPLGSNANAQCRANAHLIAAAPELLEALEFLLVAHGEQLDAAFAQARTVLAKAKGDTPC